MKSFQKCFVKNATLDETAELDVFSKWRLILTCFVVKTGSQKSVKHAVGTTFLS